MFSFRNGAVAIATALFVFILVLFLGGVNPLLELPGISLLLLICVPWAVSEFRQKGVTWNWTLTDLAVGLFLAYSIGRYFTTILRYEARMELIQVLCSGLAYFLASKGVWGKDGRRFFIYSLMVFALFQSGLGIWQAVTESDFIFNWERPEVYNGRGSGTFVCPNHLAGFLEMSLGLVVARAALVRREGATTERSILLKVVIAYISIMISAGIVTSMSRAGWASASLGLVTVVLLGGWRNRQALSRLAVVVLIFVCAGFVFWSFEPVRNYFLKSIISARGNASATLVDPTMGGRTMMWSGTLDIIREHPLFGTGMGTWQWFYQKVKDYRILSLPNYTHNDYLNLASDYGMTGVLLMVGVFVSFFRHAAKLIATVRSSEDKAFVVGSISAVVSILVHSWFDFNLHIFGNSAFLAVIMGSLSGMPTVTRNDSSAGVYRRFLTGSTAIMLCGFIGFLYLPTLMAFRLSGSGDDSKYELDYDTALEFYSRAAQIDSEYPKPLISSGDIYRDQMAWRVGPGKFRERRELSGKAIDSYDRALKLNPYLSDVWLSRGRVLEMAGKYDEAIESYMKAIDAAPVSPYAHFVLGQFYRERGESKKAVDAFEKADRYFLRNDPMFQMSQWYEEEKLKIQQKSE